MSWGRDYKLHISLGGDSTYIMDIRGLYHQSGALSRPGEAAYLPVEFDDEFIEYLKAKPLTTPNGQTSGDSLAAKSNYTTLWSALHHHVGGGYSHLINCLIYALESGSVRLNSKLMARPQTKWKPSPLTESYKRTRKWKYYVPTSQREAKKEYKERVKENALGDLQGVPPRFIDRFLATSDRDYRNLVHQKNHSQLAQIDLVRLMLGAKYLGERQIAYISQGVREAIARYTASSLPSIIIFDDYDAAVAMRLDAKGYRIDHIVFQDQQSISTQEIDRREAQIRALVGNMNEANRQLFQKRLKSYYK